MDDLVQHAVGIAPPFREPLDDLPTTLARIGLDVRSAGDAVRPPNVEIIPYSSVIWCDQISFPVFASQQTSVHWVPMA